MFYVQIEKYIWYFTKIFHLLEDPDGNLLGCIRVAKETETKNIFSKIEMNISKNLKIFRNIFGYCFVVRHL